MFPINLRSMRCCALGKAGRSPGGPAPYLSDYFAGERIRSRRTEDVAQAAGHTFSCACELHNFPECHLAQDHRHILRNAVMLPCG
jgi:hypothetical protein